MTKILYVLGTQSRNNNQELRWSLRSLEKSAAAAGEEVEPVVVGAVPRWFAGEGLDVDDGTRRKEKNIGLKILSAIESGLVDGAFQISADDHFWMKPVDFSKLPIYYRAAELPTRLPDGGGNNYDKALVGARRVLAAAGMPTYNTTVHCNMWCHTDDLEDVARLCELGSDDEYVSEYGLVNWAAWGNVSVFRGRGVPEYKTDVKIRREEDLKRFLDEPVWSCNDDAFLVGGFVSIMQERFGKPSKWEK